MDLVPLPRSGRLWKSKADFFRPFRTAAANEAVTKDPSNASESSISLLYDPSLLPEKHLKDEHEEPDLRELNVALSALVDIFPDVQPDVFREMLMSISKESRLQIVTEHILTKKAKWVKGRYRTPSQVVRPKLRKARGGSRAFTNDRSAEQVHLTDEEQFRGEAYRTAVKQVFYQEFRNLSKSTIRGVLAEQNFSYTLSRPVLQQVASRSWRFSFTSLWTKRSVENTAEARNHPFIVWQTQGYAGAPEVPAVRRTGNGELDHELHELFVVPFVTQQRKEHYRLDFEIASALNEAEAEHAEALFECECCYSSVPFESLATCDNACHILCLDCIKRTVNEALYGQGWSRTADLELATVRCFAAGDCSGSISPDLLRRALTRESGSDDAWNEFQARITSEALLQCRLPLQRCPFCGYAELQEYSKPRLRRPLAAWNHIAVHTNPALQTVFISFVLALMIFTVPIMLCVLVCWVIIKIVPPASRTLDNSILRIQKSRQTLKFSCRHPDCSKTSCTRCAAPWTDPHHCFDSEKTSLRTAIETSATAAVKRTCPKCMLSFVKSSGCNKLVCNCGYTMCYICRSEISLREGYSHFCQHFRPNAGRCPECERCDLYGDEDEEAAIRKAAEAAEKIWKEQEGGKVHGDASSKVATQLMIDALVGERKKEWWEAWMDAVLDVLIA
ncbi:Putative TRIAD supradomain-containing protein [Septoria linicola]|uniref:TRIAD supradomain-containing protein n=1 Tax=Septoria linicola TaxID=215465 RepID=A0A9Q9AWG8_9PEZI|nr:Putative TRIAD supradomain-containing protein [Septoria linicola]